MIDVLNSVKSLIKLEQIHIDNNLFKLHYKFTVIMLIIFSVLLTSKTYFGEPISCDVGNLDLKPLIDMYCWIHGTYIVKRSITNPVLPGISNEMYEDTYRNYTDQLVKNLSFGPKDKIIWQKYYQWVCIIFCVQALLFYLPRYIWKSWEGGRMTLLVKDLCGPLVPTNWDLEARDKLLKYLMSGRNGHTLYAIRYTFCEFLNLVNVVSQIFLIDWFFSGQFSFYGIAVASFQNMNPMDQVFPKIAKCMYFRHGPTSTIENMDALCVLPLNVLNEKLFLVLWIWLHALAFMTSVFLLYRFVVMCVPNVRSYLLVGHNRYVWCFKVRLMVKEISYGDFFILDHLGRNVNPVVFCDLIDDIHLYLQDAKQKCKTLPI